MYAWSNLNAAGTTKRVVTISLIYVGREFSVCEATGEIRLIGVAECIGNVRPLSCRRQVQ
jgi:hypothetical protein